MIDKPTKEHISQYRKLLVADVSINALDDVLHLAEKIAGVVVRTPFEIELATIESEESAEHERIRRLSDTLQTYMKSHFDEARLQRRRKQIPLEIQNRVWKTAVILSLPKFLAESGEKISVAYESLLFDTALLAFHQAYFALLPELQPALSRERELFLNSALAFSNSIPSVSDRERIRALVHQSNGEIMLAAFYYRQAIKAASPDSHEFLTLIQSAWSYAIEHRRFVEALDILMENAERVRREDYEELKEMLVETLEIKRAA